MRTRTNSAVWLEQYHRWQIKVRKDGVRKTFTSPIPGRAGQAACHRKADAWLAQDSAGSNVRVCDAFSDWLEELQRTTSFDHYSQYNGYGRRYILPKIGSMRVDRLDERALQGILNDAFATSNLAYKTLSNVRGCLNSFVKFCRRNQLTTLVPESLYIPRAAQKGTRRILTPAELRILFSSDLTRYYGKVQPDFYIHAYRAQAVAGLRPGELIALTQDCDLGFALATHGSINVRGEATRGKNGNAIRSISVSETMRHILNDQAAMLAAAHVQSRYIFPNPQGGPIVEKIYRQRLKAYCAYQNITSVTPYELRHTFVSAAKGLPVGLMKPMIGHSQSMDTYGVYAHELSEDDAERARLLDSVFQKILATDANKRG